MMICLGRIASTREIERAYRKLAGKFHPDRFRGKDVSEEEVKAAERKFLEITSAKEVLTDPEKRKMYDDGIDPLDPEAQAQGAHQGGPFGGMPFGGFNPFGTGGGFTFRFHFPH